MATLLETRNLGKSFSGLTVLKDVSFSLRAGTVTSLFGENGSGKTTLSHIITGYLHADHGSILYKGHDINGQKPVAVARLGVGRVWQTPRVCKNISVADNLVLAAKDHPGERVTNYFLRPRLVWQEEGRRRQKAEGVAAEVGLDGKLGESAGGLSFGQQKLLSIGMLLMNDAELLLMDEPFAGVSAQMVGHISEVLVTLGRKGRSILLIEHNRAKAEQISDSVLTLVKGEMVEER